MTKLNKSSSPRQWVGNWLLCPSQWGGVGSPSITMPSAPKAYLCTKWYPDAPSRLATVDMGRKVRAAVPFWGGSWVPI